MSTQANNKSYAHAVAINTHPRRDSYEARKQIIIEKDLPVKKLLGIDNCHTLENFEESYKVHNPYKGDTSVRRHSIDLKGNGMVFEEIFDASVKVSDQMKNIFDKNRTRKERDAGSVKRRLDERHVVNRVEVSDCLRLKRRILKGGGFGG